MFHYRELQAAISYSQHHDWDRRALYFLIRQAGPSLLGYRCHVCTAPLGQIPVDKMFDFHLTTSFSHIPVPVTQLSPGSLTTAGGTVPPPAQPARGRCWSRAQKASQPQMLHTAQASSPVTGILILLLAAVTESLTLRSQLQTPSRFSCTEPLRRPDCRAQAGPEPRGTGRVFPLWDRPTTSQPGCLPARHAQTTHKSSTDFGASRLAGATAGEELV